MLTAKFVMIKDLVLDNGFRLGLTILDLVLDWSVSGIKMTTTTTTTTNNKVNIIAVAYDEMLLKMYE